MSDISIDLRDSYIRARLNTHARTLAETRGNPQTGRGSGGDERIVEVYHGTFVNNYEGKRVCLGRNN